MGTQPELEMWENASNSQIFIQKFNTQGQIVHELVSGRRRVHISPAERRMNQEVAADDELDMFKNGTLVPVRLVDAEADTPELQANVNAMSDTAMKAMFRSQIKTFTAKVNEIGNPIALRRLLEIANELDASIKQVEVINARLSQLSPDVTETSIMSGGAAATRAPASDRAPRGVTPK